MIIYVSHIYQGKPENLERAKKITHDLQVADMQSVIAWADIHRRIE